MEAISEVPPTLHVVSTKVPLPIAVQEPQRVLNPCSFLVPLLCLSLSDIISGITTTPKLFLGFEFNRLNWQSEPQHGQLEVQASSLISPDREPRRPHEHPVPDAVVPLNPRQRPVTALVGGDEQVALVLGEVLVQDVLDRRPAVLQLFFEDGYDLLEFLASRLDGCLPSPAWFRAKQDLPAMGLGGCSAFLTSAMTLVCIVIRASLWECLVYRSDRHGIGMRPSCPSEALCPSGKHCKRRQPGYWSSGCWGSMGQ